MISALLDANVLYPAPIRDLLLSLAEDDLFKPFWSNEIHQEWKRNLLKNRPDLDPSRIDRTIYLMNQAFPDALIEGYESRIEQLSLKDSDDRHVLAAAMEANANYLVTANLMDFKLPNFQIDSVKVIHPDAFVIKLISLNPIAVFGSFEKLVSRLKNPPQSKADVLGTLVKCDLPETARVLALMQGKWNA
ncbi:PIN domain-containing protein [Cyclobacterium plantarum]|uniref:PIN domain-containing protein n=1 Tax=Cyclobacterium plantarum TaxID=2716263 RepID=A0ABX0H4W7_9BACT|nr:PIN domain-containing protein [Cyclobacterium plantarum]NHE56679.1 PIN domain-containing protein [Cyclobacterium plantarum]